MTEQQQTEQGEREAFEAWLDARTKGPTGDAPGYPSVCFYPDEERSAWAGWQARARLASPPAAAPELSDAESAADLAYLKKRVAYWDEALRTWHENAGIDGLIGSVVSMLANRDAADRAARSGSAT